MFERLARMINRVPWVVVGVAIAFAAMSGVFGGSVAKSLQVGGFQDPSSQSSVALDRLEQATGMRADGGIVALVKTPDGATSDPAMTEVSKVAILIDADPDIAKDGSSTIVVGYWKKISDQEAVNAAARLEESLKSDPNVKLGGFAAINHQLNLIITSDLARAETLAFPILFLLSLWVFRGVIAALLPPLVGGVMILGAFLVLRGVAAVHPVSIFALNLATGMGLGLAIDYSLFMVSRFREEMANGATPDVAIRTTIRTAGRTVLFSSLTIAAAAASLTVFKINFLWSMGVAGIIVALMACAVALTVLPAVLRLLGPRVNLLAPKRWQQTVATTSGTSGFWYRFSHFVMRRPIPLAALSAAVLIALGLPFAGIKFNSVDQTALLKTSDARIVNETLQRDFGWPTGAVLNVVVEAPTSAASEVESFAQSVQSATNVSHVGPPQPVGSDTWKLDVQLSGGNFDPATQDAVREIRSKPSSYTILVSGQ